MSRRQLLAGWLRRRLVPLGIAAILPEVSGRYVKRLLYGGATLLTVVIVVAMAVGVNSLIDRFINDQQQLFLQHRELVKSRVERYQVGLRNYVENYEALWRLHDRDWIPLQRYRQRLLTHQGVTLTESDLTATSFGVLTTLTAPDQQQRLATLLRLIREISPEGHLQGRETGYFLGGFTYSTDERFLATVPPLPESVLQAAQQGRMPEIIRQRIGKVEEELSKYSDHTLARQRIFWLPLHDDPFSGQTVNHFASPVFRDGKRVAVIVVTVPFNQFAHLFQNGAPVAGFFAVSRLQKHLFGTNDDDANERRWSKALLAHPDILGATMAEHPQIVRDNGVFFIYQTIPGPNWIAVYAFDWMSILAGLWPELSLLSALMLMVLLILWAFVVILDRFVFTPLQLHEQRVHESEAFNRTVIETAPVGLGVVDPVSGEVVLQNDIAANLLYHDPIGSGDFYQRILTSSGSHSRTQRGIEFSEMTVNDGAGGQRDMVAAFSRTRYRERDVVLFGLTDISERKETERLMHEAKIAADQANQAKSMFLATMSHEIRTPLHGALGNLELLAMENLSLQQKERVNTIRRSFDALLSLINDILDISKVEANELTLQQEPFSPHALAEQCAQTFAPVIHGKNVRFLCLISPLVPDRVLGDRHRIAQILMNLLSNASKFTESGAIALRVEPGEVCGKHAWLRFSVSDSGTGISAEYQRHIFAPFSQADGSISRRFGGTGLGLSLCKRLTDLMGGRLEVDSEPDVGSIFTVTLPLQTVAENCGQRDAPMQISIPAGPQASVRHAERILVVEDDPVSRALIASQLAALGYDHVEAAFNGRQALERCRSGTYDVIISDLNMPVMDGKMLLSALRAKGIATPVIVNTACTAQDLDTSQHDFAHVLHKPVSIDQVDDALARVLGKQAKARVVTTRSIRDATVTQQLQTAFLASWEVDVNAMKEAVLSGDNNLFQRRLHRLKGALLVMQEHDATSQCALLQQRVNTNGSAAVADLLPRFWTTMQEIVDRYQAQSIS